MHSSKFTDFLKTSKYKQKPLDINKKHGIVLFVPNKKRSIGFCLSETKTWVCKKIKKAGKTQEINSKFFKTLCPSLNANELIL